MGMQKIFWASLAGREAVPFARVPFPIPYLVGTSPVRDGRFLAPPQLGVPPIPHQETGSYFRPSIVGLAKLTRAPDPTSLPPAKSSLRIPRRCGGWECLQGEIRGLSEQGRLMGSSSCESRVWVRS